MGILDKLKKRLPLVGGATPPPLDLPQRPAARPPLPSRPPRLEEEAAPASPRGSAPPRAWIEEQVRAHPVVLFMKGSPTSPACGFSANASAILFNHLRTFHHVDVLLDADVRNEVKAVSGWPTIPQVYIRGEFVGGSDILTELEKSGELKALIAAAVAPPAQA